MLSTFLENIANGRSIRYALQHASANRAVIRIGIVKAESKGTLPQLPIILGTYCPTFKLCLHQSSTP